MDSKTEKTTHKGFIYRTEDNKWVLAKEPNLKSCCHGKDGQLFLDGDFSQCKSHKAYTVQGELMVNNLENAHLVGQGAFPLLSLLLIALLAIMAKFLIKS